MREIKFRAWEESSKVMVDWLCMRQTAFNTQSIADQHRAKNIFNPLFYRIFNNPIFVLMQYTGLKDKNGKEIYEGDIILISKERMELIGGSLMKVVVGFKDGSFMVGRNNHEHLNTYLWLLVKWEPEDVEIIGNIYENPELLEVT